MALFDSHGDAGEGCLILIMIIPLIPIALIFIILSELYKYIFRKQIERAERLEFLKRKRHQRDMDLEFGYCIKWYKSYFWSRENSKNYPTIEEIYDFINARSYYDENQRRFINVIDRFSS